MSNISTISEKKINTEILLKAFFTIWKMSHNIFEAIFKFLCVNSLLQIKSFSILYRIQRDLDLCFVKKENTGIHIMLISQVRNTDSEKKDAMSLSFQPTPLEAMPNWFATNYNVCVCLCVHMIVCVCYVYMQSWDLGTGLVLLKQ